MPPHASNRRPVHIQKKHHADHDLIVERLEEYIKVYRTGNPEAMMQFYHPTDFAYSDFCTLPTPKYRHQLISSQLPQRGQGNVQEDLHQVL